VICLSVQRPHNPYVLPRQAHGVGSGGAARSEVEWRYDDGRLLEDILVEEHDSALCCKDIFVFMVV
jgi:hypothetical protein